MASKVEVARSDYAAFFPVTTRWQDNDNNGVINNVAYYSYFDSATNQFLIKHCGLDIKFGSIVGMVVSSSCEYISPISFPAKIDVGIRIDRLGNSSVQFSVAIFEKQEPFACAFGHFIEVFVDRVSKKPMMIPDSMRKKMEKILVSNAN